MEIIAICGLNCAECSGYLATQANDEAAKERVAAEWRVMFHAPGVDAKYVTCDSCRAFGGRLGGHCAECDIRACGMAHGVINCAHCDDYERCERINGFLAQAPQARARLDGIRATLV